MPRGAARDSAIHRDGNRRFVAERRRFVGLPRRMSPDADDDCKPLPQYLGRDGEFPYRGTRQYGKKVADSPPAEFGNLAPEHGFEP